MFENAAAVKSQLVKDCIEMASPKPTQSNMKRSESEDHTKEEHSSSSLTADLWYIDMKKNHKRESVVSETRSVGWNSVKKRLGTIAAVKTVIDSTKKDRIRKPFEQQDFLEKFSTRDKPVKNGKRTSTLASARRVSIAIESGRNHMTSVAKASDTSKAPVKVELNDIKSNNTIDIDELYESDSDRDGICSSCKSYLRAPVEPYGNFLYYWLFLVITAIHYNAWIVFTRIAFEDAQKQYKTLWIVSDCIADSIYLLDIIVYLRLSFLEDGIYIDNLYRLALAYIKSYQFALDVVSVIPLDISFFFIGVYPSLRMLRLLKYYKVFIAQKTILALTNYPNIIRTAFFLHLMLIMMHWNGCFYFMVSKHEGFGINQWVYPKLNESQNTLFHQYLLCYYWSTLSLTTIGGSYHPETTIECAYMIVCYAIGIFIFATIVGQAGNVIQNMNASRIDFEKQRDSTMQYMKRHNVPYDIQRRVRLWYDYSYSRGRFQGDNDVNDILLLPNKMKTELALHVHLETLRRVTFLQKCQPEFLHDLVLKMKMIIFTPGDYICKKGEVAREMYVISDGILEVLSETGRILKVLHSGDFFGEIGILSLSKGQNKRTADVRAFGYVELFVLSKDDVLNAIREYPDAQKILAKYGRNRLKKDTIVQGGPRADTSSDSDDDQESTFLNLNNSSASTNFEERKRSDSRHSISRRSSFRRDVETRRGSNLKIQIPTESDLKSPKPTRMIAVSEKFAPSSSLPHGAMMSAINPILHSTANGSTGLVTNSKGNDKRREKSGSVASILINNDVIDVDDSIRDDDSIKENPKNRVIDTEKLIEMMQANQEEVLNSIKLLFKKKMMKNQKKLLERIQDLERVSIEKDREIQDLKKNLLKMEDSHVEDTVIDAIDSSNDNAYLPELRNVPAKPECKEKKRSKSISPTKVIETARNRGRSKSTSDNVFSE